jgi:hypothetical protein
MHNRADYEKAVGIVGSVVRARDLYWLLIDRDFLIQAECKKGLSKTLRYGL